MTTINEAPASTIFEVRTTVKFAAAHETFERPYTSTVLASEVLTHALHAFEVTTDGTARYYLFHNGVEVAADQMIGALTDEHSEHRGVRELTLRLRTETTSGVS